LFLKVSSSTWQNSRNSRQRNSNLFFCAITIYGWRIISKELNIPVYHDNEFTFGGKTFLGHGDGKDLATRIQTDEKVFTNPFFNGF
jgi:hypothetical protein